MSRYSVEHKVDGDDDVTAVVGWDNPMNTFFCQVTRTPEDPDFDPEFILHEGASFDDHTDIHGFISAIEKYVTLTEDVIEKLIQDQESATLPTNLQRLIRVLAQNTDLLEINSDDMAKLRDYFDGKDS